MEGGDFEDRIEKDLGAKGIEGGEPTEPGLGDKRTLPELVYLGVMGG
jgi:hypothetical protein